MEQQSYWLFSLILSASAFAVSLTSAFYSYKKNKWDQSEKLTAKKTDVFITINQLHDNVSELLLVTAEQIMLFQQYESLINSEFKQHIRLRNNLELLKEKRELLNGMRRELQDVSSNDNESWESMKATYQIWSNNIRSNVEKEQKVLLELKEKIGEVNK
ncbi:MAG: hypothetical protein ACXV8U_21160 [Methylobacter sp.]